MNNVLSKNYQVNKLNSPTYAYVIQSHNYLDPFEELENISTEIDCDNCTVLFDLLLKNGNRDDRFYSINYSNNTFDLNSLTHITDIPNDIRKHCCKYYYNNQYLFENTILPLPLVFLIKKGQII